MGDKTQTLPNNNEVHGPTRFYTPNTHPLSVPIGFFCQMSTIDWIFDCGATDTM